MSLRWYYLPSWASGTAAVEFTDVVPDYSLDLAAGAEEANVEMSRIPVEDPLAAFEFVPLARVWVTDDEVAQSSNTRLWSGIMGSRTFRRDPDHAILTGSSRVIEIEVMDDNSILSRRILSSPNANRPAETDVARVTWLANEADGQLLIDSTEFLSSANPVSMDAVDYRGQTGQDVLRDCMDASGKNGWIDVKEGVGYRIWYGANDLTTHSSIIRLTNVYSETGAAGGDANTFEISDDTTLTRDPSRLASSVYYRYAGGAVYVRNHAMFQRIGLRDVALGSDNVKSLAAATTRANRHLADLDTEEDRIETKVRLPRAKGALIRQGHRLQFRSTHLPGYESFVWLRVLKKQIAQVDEEFFLLSLTLATDSIPAEPVPDTFPASAILYLPTGDGGTGAFGIEPEVRWQGTGESHPPGFPTIPLVGSLEYVSDSLVPTYPYKGVRALGSGTLTVTFKADDTAGVVGTVTCVPSIVKNGGIVASSSHTSTDAAAPGFPYSHVRTWDFSTTVSVVAGDVISAQFTSTWGNMKVPAGTSDPSHKLLIDGDLT